MKISDGTPLPVCQRINLQGPERIMIWKESTPTFQFDVTLGANDLPKGLWGRWHVRGRRECAGGLVLDPAGILYVARTEELARGMRTLGSSDLFQTESNLRHSLPKKKEKSSLRDLLGFEALHTEGTDGDVFVISSGESRLTRYYQQLAQLLVNMYRLDLHPLSSKIIPFDPPASAQEMEI